MDYKLVCIDMDGTLLNERHKVSEATGKAIRKAHDNGVHIVISTGRMYTDAEGFSNLVVVKSPVIASNGALVKEKGTEEVIYKSILGEELAMKLLDIFLKYNESPTFYTSEKAYCGSIIFKAFMEYARHKGIIDKSVKSEYVRSRKQWNSILKREKDNIVKCELIDKDAEKLRKVRAGTFYIILAVC